MKRDTPGDMSYGVVKHKPCMHEWKVVLGVIKAKSPLMFVDGFCPKVTSATACQHHHPHTLSSMHFLSYAHMTAHHAEATWMFVVLALNNCWIGCSAMASSPKPFPFLNDLLSAHIWQDMPMLTNWSSFHEHTDYDIHKTVTQQGGTGGWADTDNCWWNTASHSLPHHPPIKTHLLFLFLLPSLNVPWLEAIAR